MEERFTLPISYKGKEQSVDFTFRKLGYTYKISAWIDGQEVLFEPDEEGSFRATLTGVFGDSPADPRPDAGSFPDRQERQYKQDHMDRAFIRAVIEKLTDTFK